MYMVPGKYVSFFTCCYEADWEYLLIDGRLKEMISRFNYQFAERCLIINNVKDKEMVLHHASQAVNEDIIDNFYFSEELIDRVFEKFCLKRKSFRLDGFDGYWFSIAPLTSIFLCDTDYLLYFTADCMLEKTYSFNWINAGILKLADDEILITSPLWNYYNGKKDQFIREDDDCFYDQGFSDQAFIANAKRLKAVNFNEYNKKAEIFPIYGGNHFERRIFCYMNNRDLKRCVFKNIVYRHDLLVKPDYKRKIGSNDIMINKLKYAVAKIKRKLRKKHILVKLLLRS